MAMENYLWFLTQPVNFLLTNLKKLNIFVSFNIFAFCSNFSYVVYFYTNNISKKFLVFSAHAHGMFKKISALN